MTTEHLFDDDDLFKIIWTGFSMVAVGIVMTLLGLLPSVVDAIIMGASVSVTGVILVWTAGGVLMIRLWKEGKEVSRK